MLYTWLTIIHKGVFSTQFLWSMNAIVHGLPSTPSSLITRLVIVIQSPLARVVIKEWILDSGQDPLLLIWGFSGADGDILPFLSGYKIGNLLRPHSVIRLSPLF